MKEIFELLHKLIDAVASVVTGSTPATATTAKEDQPVPRTTGPEIDKYDDMFMLAGLKFDWMWLKAISQAESRIGRDPRVRKGEVSRDKLSRGLMQIAVGKGSPKEIELKGFASPDKQNDPWWQIQTATKLLNYLYERFDGEMIKVIRSYNQGERNTAKGKNYTHPNGKYYERVKMYYQQAKTRTLK